MRVLVVGDDLTGCNATAIRLRRLGWDVITAVRYDRVPDFRLKPVWIWNSESRLLPPALAADRMRKMLAQLQLQQTESAFLGLQFAKRIDSTFRGPIVAETEMLLRSVPGPVYAVVVAAFPGSGRTVEDGRLLVHGVPVDETELAHDPFTPVITASLQDLITGSGTLPVMRADPAWLCSDGAEQAYPAVRATLGDRGWIICDARSDEDIDHWAAFFAGWPTRVLPVDPGPFTAAWLAATRRRQGSVLVIGGSAMPTLSRQLDTLEAETGVRLLRLDVCHLRSESLTAMADALVEQARQQRVFGVRTDQPSGPVHTPPGEIAAMLAGLTAKVLRRVPAAHLYVSGGEVANEVLRRLEADTLLPLVEVEPLCVLSEVLAGPWRGLRVVTKGGSVGSERVIVKSVQLLTGAPGREGEPSAKERKDDV